MSCGVGCRHSLDLVLLGPWRKPVAAALIQLLAWEPLYAVGAALKSKKNLKNFDDTVLCCYWGNQYHTASHGVFFFFFLRSRLRRMEVPGPGIESDLQLRPSPQLLWQRQILNPLHRD